MSNATTDFELDSVQAEGGSISEPIPTLWSRDEDDQLLKELYALMGDIPKEPPEPETPVVKKEAEAVLPETKPKEAPAAAQAPAQKAENAPVPAQPVSRLPEQEPDAQQPYVQEDWEETPSEGSVPGWLKGTFLFLISLLLCGMTLYAVAVDVLGPLF